MYSNVYIVLSMHTKLYTSYINTGNISCDLMCISSDV